MMELLLDTDLNIDIALNLDGGPSTLLTFASEEFEEDLLPITTLPQVISIDALD